MSDEFVKACGEGVKGAVEQYLAAGGDPDAADEYGTTGLMWAAYNGHLDIVRAVLRAGADPDRQRWDGWTALMAAAGGGQDHPAGLRHVRRLQPHAAVPRLAG